MRPAVAFACLLAPLALLPAIDPPAATGPPRGYVAVKANAPPTIDGIADACWDAAAWSDDFVDIEGPAKPKPRHRTRMKMLWDDAALYLLAELTEPDVWATIRQHDAVIFHDNDFELFLDPDGDGHLYAELELNALNTTWDLLLPKPYKDGGAAIDAWEIAGLKTAVRIDGTLNDPRDVDRGWTVEIAWPWTGLKPLAKNVPPKDGDRWRVNCSRVEWDTTVVDGKTTKVKGKPEHNWVWSPQGVIDMHRPERWGIVQFRESAKAFEPDPHQADRDLLFDLYYRQRAYEAKRGRYAKMLADLGGTGLAGTTLETTAGGYEARRGRVAIREDARVTVRTAKP
jgi:hypothetical protein